MSHVDVDALMRDAGERWRNAQPQQHDGEVQTLVDVGRPSGRPWPLVVLAATVAVACVATLAFLFQQALAPATGPVRPAAPVTTTASITPGQLIGTWHSSVSVTEARKTYHALVGDWVLTLSSDGTARLARADGAEAARGSWRLSGDALTLHLPFAGCTTVRSTYQASIAALHGMLQLVTVDGAETCHARSLVLGGHWS